ncbi:MAG: gas vesicle protein K [Methylococcus sp.]|nr:gas vesicle protein K [Methylococcus sp.]
MSHSIRIALSPVGAASPGAERTAPELDSSALQLGGEKAAQGLAQLVLILVKLLHELLERQALRRVESGSLGGEELDRLGQALMQQAAEIERLCEVLGLEPDDLNLDLGPLGRLFD